MIEPEIATNIAVVLMTLERLAIVVCIAFIWTRLPFFKTFQQNNYDLFDKKLSLKLILVFSVFGIIGTLAGIVIDIGNISYEPFTHRVYDRLNSANFLQDILFTDNEAIINFRVMILVVAGLLGGPLVGLFSGIIVGLQRWSLGGFSDLINLSSSISVGLIAGLLFYCLTPKQRQSPYVVMLVCFLMEILRRTYLVAFSDGGQGELLMRYIALPMIIGNTIGGYIFMKVIEMVNTEQNLVKEKIQRLVAEAKIEKEKDKRKNAEVKSFLLYMLPHFLTSSLLDIKAKISTDPNQAEKLTIALSGFCKKSLQGINKWSGKKEDDAQELTIKDEIAHIKDYIIIMREDRPNINFIESYDQNLKFYKCSLFVLQPLVENAIHYGCKNINKNYTISVSIAAKGNQICLSVKDDGEGMTEEVKQKLGHVQVTTSRFGSGMGVFNIIHRLKIIFDTDIHPVIQSDIGKGTSIEILIPQKAI